jgi:hypothetical protein
VSNATFFQSVRGARSERPVGFIGEFSRSSDFRSITGVNQDPQAKQITTIAIPASPDSSEEYSVTIDGVESAYTSDGSATQAEVGAGLVEAINAEPGARAKMVASYSAGTLTLTGVWPGVTSTVTAAGGTGGGAIGSPSTSTSAASADVVAFGRCVATDGFVTNEGTPKVFVPTTSKFTAQVVSFTFAGNTGSYYSGFVEINGRKYNWSGVVWDTNLDTTCTAIAAAINAVMPTETVIAASVGSGGGVVTLTAEVEGAEFDAVALAVGHADAEVTKAFTTGPSRATSLVRAMVGVSVRRLDVENQTVDGDDPAYAANEGVEVCSRGLGLVQRDTSETWAWGDDIYVSLASATKGRFYNVAGTDRVWIGRSKVAIERSEHSTTTDGVGFVRVDMGA